VTPAWLVPLIRASLSLVPFLAIIRVSVYREAQEEKPLKSA